MKKIVSAAVLVLLGGVLAFVVQRFACSSPDYAELRARNEAKIDSLQRVIEQRNRRIQEIETSIQNTQSEIAELERRINDKDRQINYYKGKGRFDYVQSMDSLHAELNRLIRQRLAEVDSTGRTPR